MTDIQYKWGIQGIIGSVVLAKNLELPQFSVYRHRQRQKTEVLSTGLFISKQSVSIVHSAHFNIKKLLPKHNRKMLLINQYLNRKLFPISLWNWIRALNGILFNTDLHTSIPDCHHLLGILLVTSGEFCILFVSE